MRTMDLSAKNSIIFQCLIAETEVLQKGGPEAGGLLTESAHPLDTSVTDKEPYSSKYPHQEL